VKLLSGKEGGQKKEMAPGFIFFILTINPYKETTNNMILLDILAATPMVAMCLLYIYIMLSSSKTYATNLVDNRDRVLVVYSLKTRHELEEEGKENCLICQEEYRDGEVVEYLIASMFSMTSVLINGFA